MLKVACVILIALSIIQISDLLGNPNRARQNCEQNTVQLTNLLSTACENIDNTANCRRNFMLAVRAQNNQPSIVLLRLYADVYYAGTVYSECVDIIDRARPSSNEVCVSGYCQFVRCIRRINSDMLIAQCYSEASIYNTAELQADQVILYKNITSCILATARCSGINPITGQPQSSGFIRINRNTCGKPVYSTVRRYNALQINPAGDLRIISLTSSTSIQKYLCPYEFNLRETSWMNYNC